ncbi:hypothetical protein niasHT_006373 [Heterodera trifolii]|uniref:Uncharacterized protein n=1 Tax=Heterodera trifolii TaxID=157864 RepID=A0ABD2LPW4_9BILA
MKINRRFTNKQCRAKTTPLFQIKMKNKTSKGLVASKIMKAKEKQQKQQQHNKPKIDHHNQPKIDDLLKGLARLQLDHSQQSGGVLVAMPSPQTTM